MALSVKESQIENIIYRFKNNCVMSVAYEGKTFTNLEMFMEYLEHKK